MNSAQASFDSDPTNYAAIETLEAEAQALREEADAAKTNAETAEFSAISDDNLLKNDLADIRTALAAALAAKEACDDQLAITSTL